MTLRSLPIVLAAAAAMLALTGCGSDRPETVPVTGTVTYRGQTVAGARVMFMATEATATSGPAASGQTDAEGRFALMTFTPGDGAAVGKYKVLITKREEVPDPSQPDSPYKLTRDMLPPRYGNPSQSDLKAEVTAEGPNDFPFALKD